MGIKTWIRAGYSDEIKTLIDITEATGREAMTKFCANNPKEKATGSIQTYTSIAVEGKDPKARFSQIRDFLSCPNFEVGSIHTHPKATEENLRLSEFDRQNVEEKKNVVCVASPNTDKVVCEDHRFEEVGKFSFNIGD